MSTKESTTDDADSADSGQPASWGTRNPFGVHPLGCWGSSLKAGHQAGWLKPEHQAKSTGSRHTPSVNSESSVPSV